MQAPALPRQASPLLEDYPQNPPSSKIIPQIFQQQHFGLGSFFTPVTITTTGTVLNTYIYIN